VAHEVFISYSARDKPAADAACAKLEASGIRCWIAPRDIRPGMSWGGSIVEAIDGASVMMLLFSSHANTSPQIHREVERVVHRGLVIIPVRVQDVQPSGDFEYFLGTPHWLDAVSLPFEQHLDKIADSAKFWLERIHANQAEVAQAEIKPASAVPRVAEKAPAAEPAIPVPRRKSSTGLIVGAAIVVVGIGLLVAFKPGPFAGVSQTALNPPRAQPNSTSSPAKAAPAAMPTADPQVAATLAALHLRSMENSIPATVTFTNQLTSGVTGYWIDFDGTARRFFELGTGESLVQPTYQNHVWVVVDGRGTPLRTYTAKPGDQSVTLTAAGFACSKAISPSEKLICSDPTLANLDQEMVAAYRDVIQNTNDAKAWKADQLRWLAERDRCQDDDGCLRSEYQARVVILRAAAPKVAWANHWWRVDASGGNGSELVITQVTSTGFEFSVEASAGANSGELSGKATFDASGAAHYRGDAQSGTEGCSLTFSRVLNRLNIDQKGDDASCGAGRGVYFSGTYVASAKDPNTPPDLVSLGVLQSKAQDDAVRKLLGDDDYQAMVATADLVDDHAEDLDGKGANVVSMQVRGVACNTKSILMYDDKGHLWAAVWKAISNPEDVVELRYFTNVASDKNTLPKTISAWRAACPGETVRVVMMPRNR
jgi:uncharacterized protein